MNKRILKKIISTFSVVALTGSMAISSIIPSSDTIINPNDYLATSEVVATLDDDDNEKKYTFAKKSTKKVKDKAIEFLNKLPLPIRAFIVLPLYYLGNFILNTISTLFTFAGGSLIFLLLKLALFFIAAIILYKMIFPNAKIKNLFKKNNIMILLGVGISFCVLDGLALTFLNGYGKYRFTITSIVGLSALTTIYLKVKSFKVNFEKKYIVRLDDKVVKL